jgi:transporter family protein
MSAWVWAGLACCAMWGLSRFFPKLATQHIDPQSAFAFEVAGEAIIAVAILAGAGFRPNLQLRGVSYALLAGVFGGLGVYAYLLGAQRGHVSQLVIVSALYPVITVLLGVLVLGEPFSARQLAGLVLALAAILLVAT